MTVRTWVYGRLTSFPGLIALIGENNPRVFAKKSMTSSVEQHPYLVYKMATNTAEDLAEDIEVSRQFITIFVHDHSDGETGDYMRIDSVIEQIKKALVLQSSAADGVIAVKYLETSQDLNDETLNTVMKYIRLQAITKEP